MSPQPRRGDICPPHIRMRIAPSTAINHSTLALAVLSRLPTFPMPPLAGLRINRGPFWSHGCAMGYRMPPLPRLKASRQDAAA